MRNYVTILAFLCVSDLLQATPGLDGNVTLTTDTTINEYAQVTNITNAANITITVDDINNLDDSQGIYTNNDLSVGDRIMLYQAQGANYATAGDNSSSYGAFNVGNAGRYEIHEVISVNGNDIVVAEIGNLCLPDQLIYSFDSADTQVIRVPQFNNLTINNGVVVTPAPWNGNIGGVLAMDIAGTLTVNGTIDASGLGFRGGVIDNLSSPASEGRPGYFYASANDGAEKGESILGFQAEYDAYGGRYGRGAPANGGGGGNGHNAGGGGGANGDNGDTWLGQGNPDLSGINWNQAWDIDGTLTSTTTSSGGGRGGYTYGRSDMDALTVPPGDATWTGNNRRELGGLGGRPLPFDDVGRLYFGGGGGAGDGNNSQAGAGGAGGGLIFIVADTILGNGQITANGADGEDTQGGGNNDAPGGGGAGGTVVISANALTGITINADGGLGGNQLNIGNESEGPGGGGGGGVISISGGAVTTSANGGVNGLSDSDSVTEFMANGATMGAGGQPNEATSPVTDLPICVAGADVQVDKTLTSSGPYIAGSTVTYSITVTNNGALTATNVQVNDTPTNLTINTVSSTNCSAFPCTIPSLLNGASEVITVSATINATGTFDNSTTVTADQPDPDPSNNTDNTGNSGTAGASADVAVTKTLDTAGPYSNGQSIQYTLVVSNNGPDTANNVVVTDTPTNLTINTVSSASCSAFPCTIPSLANGSNETITVTATINAIGTFDNSTTVSADEPDPDPSNNTDNTGNSGTAGASADVAVTKTLDTAGPYSNGQSIQYTLVVSNNGPDTANNVVVTDTPTNLTINTVSSASCSAFPCTIPSLANGSSETITVTATINAIGTFDNSTTVSADEPDPNPSNNTDNSGNSGTAGASADVAVTKTLDTAGPYSNGQSIQYTLVVSNNGPDTANNVVVTDTPTNLTINTVSSASCSAFPCTIPSLANGSSETITVTATINASGPFDNATSVSADETDPDPSNNDDNTGNGGTSGVSADVQVIKDLTSTGPYIAGDTVTYNITVTNNGPDTANNIQVTDTPTNLTLVTVSSTNCSGFTCTIPSLANGASEVITVTATIDATGAFDNVTAVSADETDPDTTNNTDNTGNGGTAGVSADMQVVKDLTSTGPYVAGDTVTYSITVTNNGPDTANNVMVTDTPTNLTIVTVSSTNCSAFPCTISSMTSGASEVITVSATIDATGAFDNASSVSATETDPDPSNNDDNTGNGGTAGVSADMQVVKDLTSTGPYVAGDTVTYSITVTNNGPDTANNVQVTDTPTNLTIVTVSSTNCTGFPCTISSMASGASEVITVTATIDATGAFDNATTVSADETDPDTTNNADNTGNGGTAGTSADMAIVKTLLTSGPFSPGQSIQYSLVVSNNGPDTANNVVVTDTPTNLTITSVSSTNCSALPCTIPSMINGGSETITVTAVINAPGNFDNAAAVSADETDPDTSNNQDNTGNGGTVSAPARPVPSLNQWALFILIGLMAVMGMRRRFD